MAPTKIISQAPSLQPPTFQAGDPLAADVAASLNGDRAAFGRLVTVMETRVFRFIMRHVSAVNAAEDLTQDTFLEAWRKLGNFKGQSRFSTWLLGIAFNLARNYRTRAPERRYRMESDEKLDRMAHEGPDPEQAAGRAAMASALDAAIQALPDDLRDAIVMVSLDGMPYDEAAEVTGIPIGTMKTRVFRARKQLRETIEQSGQMDLMKP